ncbi:MAG: PAS domain S-box protein [Ignavibacteriales bacterium]|nr:PAS domain S-box protein [Ignavibacteriales bacterium]
MNSNTNENTKMLLSSAKQRQTKLLSTIVESYTKNMGEWCFDYTYWDEMVKFVKYPDEIWASRNIVASSINYDVSFVWVLDSDFNQRYGYQAINNNKLSSLFISKSDLKNVVKKNWFSNLFISKDGEIFEIQIAPVQPSMDLKRETEPKGWFIAGKIYKDKFLEEISHTTNSNIKVVFTDSIESFKEKLMKYDVGVYTQLPIKDINQNTIAYITSFHIDKATEKYLISAQSSIPVIAIISLLFFGSIFTLLLIYIVKPLSVLSQSLSSEDETKLIPLLRKQNEFGALSRMMERFFIQKKHLETEIEIRTETEEELKEIQLNLENLVEARTAELLNANNLMQVERDQAKLYLEMAGAVICLIDENADILLINKMGYDILGYEEGTLIGKNWMSFCYDEANVNACNIRFRALILGTDDSCADYTFSLLTSNGEERKLLINSIVTKNPLNGKRAILFSGIDITAIKKTENDLIEAIERAEKANKAQAAFFANMSHELRTPLFGVLGYSEMMESGDYNEEVKHMASTINKSGKRLIETLNKVLSLSKLKADKYEIKISEVNINSLIAETVNLFQVDAAAKGLNLFFTESKSEIITQTDSSVIRDMMNNLIHNAIKFTFYGSVHVSLQSDNETYTIKVKDTGIGIPQESVDIIFEEFRQVSEGYSRSFEGTGLGLAITKNYIDLLNGKIELSSAVNNGSEFIITLPIKQKEKIYAN